MKKEVPIKNYIILVIISILTVMAAIYLVIIYNKAKEYNSKENVISDFLLHLVNDNSKDSISNIDNYLIDNPNTVIYISSSNDKKYKKFEEEFKQFIIEENLKNNIVYLDSSKIKKEVYDFIEENYFSDSLKNKKIDLNIIPNLIILEKGKVVDILYNYKTDINVNDVKEFLIENEVIEK